MAAAISAGSEKSSVALGISTMVKDKNLLFVFFFVLLSHPIPCRLQPKLYNTITINTGSLLCHLQLFAADLAYIEI